VFFRKLKWNIIGQRRYWFALSGAVIIAGIFALVMHHGLPLGLSFTGGTTIDVKFNRTVTDAEVRAALRNLDLTKVANDLRPQYAGLQAGTETLQLASKPGDSAPNDRVIIAAQSAITDAVPIYQALDKAGLTVDQNQSQISSVGASLSREYLSRSLWALIIALALQLVYIAFRFGNQLRYGIISDLKLVHDVFIMIGVYAITNRKADDAFLAALLTVIGWSVMDSIVIFDRIRENGRLMPDVPYDQMVNTSLLQTMTRSVNTLATVLITLLALFLFGGDTLKNFAFALLVGVTSGAYSSIFFASPLLVIWKNIETKKREAQRAIASGQDTQARMPGQAGVSPNAASTLKRTPPKRKVKAGPPPRYRRKRPAGPAAAAPSGGQAPSQGTGGIIGLLAELNQENGGDAESGDRLPGDSQV
jgi:preprotein translocase subunit SecF